MDWRLIGGVSVLCSIAYNVAAFFAPDIRSTYLRIMNHDVCCPFMCLFHIASRWTWNLTTVVNSITSSRTVSVFLPPTIQSNIHLFVDMPHSASSMSAYPMRDQIIGYPSSHLAEYVVSPSLLFLSPPPLTSHPPVRHTSSVEIIFRHSLAKQVSRRQCSQLELRRELRTWLPSASRLARWAMIRERESTTNWTFAALFSPNDMYRIDRKSQHSRTSQFDHVCPLFLFTLLVHGVSVSAFDNSTSDSVSTFETLFICSPIHHVRRLYSHLRWFNIKGRSLVSAPLNWLSRAPHRHPSSYRFGLGNWMPAKYGERMLMVKRMKLGDVGTVAMGSLGIRRSGKWSVESQHLRGLHILIPNR